MTEHEREYNCGELSTGTIYNYKIKNRISQKQGNRNKKTQKYTIATAYHSTSRGVYV
jgi:hypothetical protein